MASHPDFGRGRGREGPAPPPLRALAGVPLASRSLGYWGLLAGRTRLGWPWAGALATPAQSLSWLQQRLIWSLALGPRPPCPAPLNPSEPLTQTPAYGQRAIAEAQLICFDNPRPGRPYEIAITFPEFTCLCPFSGYPDFASLRLIYQPGPRVMELKALKLYVNSWRDRSISHEEVTNRIVDDWVAACAPSWLQLEADFNPRGNVHTVIRVSHGQRQPC